MSKLPRSGNANLRRSIIGRLTYLFCLDSAALLNVNEQQFYLFGQVQTSEQEANCTVTLTSMVSVRCLGRRLVTTFFKKLALPL